VPGDGRTAGGQAGVDLLLQRAPHPTAVFCYNDMTAIGALRAVKAAGLRVPGDLSLVGYDDIAFAVFVDPPLTTIAQAKRALGQRAMDLALAILDGQEETGDILLTPHLVERASCAPPAPGAGMPTPSR
jgi:LacI family repressor for deo operon, udp, cdd, tsx, nupC, and nupG